MVPNGWTQKFLEDIAEFSQGIQVNPDKQFTEYSEGMVRFLRITDFVDQDETPRFIQNPSNRFIVNNTDLSMVRYGSAGAGDLVRGLSGAIANNLFRVIPNELEVTKDYLWVYLSQSKIKHFLFGNSTSSTMPAVSFKLVGKVLVDLPPLPEQQKIAKILSTWDKAIGTTERLIENSTQQKKALMQQLLTGKKRLLDDEGERFEGEWDWVDLEDVCDVKGGKRLPKGNALSEAKTSNPYIRVADMYMGGVDLSDIKYVPESIAPLIKNYTISKDDLFITVAGTLGIVGKIPNELDGANLTENADKLTNIKCDKTFLLYVMMSSIIQRYIEAESTQNAQPKLALARIRGFKVPLPNLEEQQKIATVLTNADKEIELLEQQLADLQQEKKALMQVLLTGKVRVLVNGEVA
tara:strand:+ start:90 stop:1313 length:1224 start_codon:yes stop_codon:yes gene_type:complete